MTVLIFQNIQISISIWSVKISPVGIHCRLAPSLRASFLDGKNKLLLFLCHHLLPGFKLKARCVLAVRHEFICRRNDSTHKFSEIWHVVSPGCHHVNAPTRWRPGVAANPRFSDVLNKLTAWQRFHRCLGVHHYSTFYSAICCTRCIEGLLDASWWISCIQCTELAFSFKDYPLQFKWTNDFFFSNNLLL